MSKKEWVKVTELFRNQIPIYYQNLIFQAVWWFSKHIVNKWYFTGFEVKIFGTHCQPIIFHRERSVMID